VRAAPAYTALAVGFVAWACATPEKQLESGRRYLSITYTDTTVESFSRTDRAVTGVLIWQGGDSIRFRIRTLPEALVSGVDLTVHPASNRGEGLHTTRVGMPKGTLPVMATSVAFLEQLLRRARVVGGDSVSVPVMALGRQATLSVLTVIANGSDSVVLVTPDGNLATGFHLAVDPQGRILGGGIPASATKILSVDASP
jgi:hypothetical protein